MKRNASIDDYLKPLASCPLQCYLTNTLQVADVVEWVLEQVGRATILLHLRGVPAALVLHREIREGGRYPPRP